MKPASNPSKRTKAEWYREAINVLDESDFHDHELVVKLAMENPKLFVTMVRELAGPQTAEELAINAMGCQNKVVDVKRIRALTGWDLKKCVELANAHCTYPTHQYG